jgi:sugar phosphate isomerase/epimerase
MHPRVSINSQCFSGSSLRAVTGYWRDLGVHRVSFLDTLLDAPDARAALAEGNFQIETVIHPFMPGHLQPDEETWRAPREALTRMIRAAPALGIRSIYISSGGLGTLTWEEAAKCFCAAIAPCAAEAKAAGIPLLLENTPPLYATVSIVHNLRDALTLAEMAGLGLCVDLFSCWMEAGLRDTIMRTIPRGGIVQLSDYVYGDRTYSCRAVPGDGAIPLRRLIGWTLEAGYQGSFDIEMMGPRIDKEGHLAATARAARNLGDILTALGV